MINIDEPVKALRDMATYDCGFEEESDTVTHAADAIEALQAENISLRAERDQARLDCAIAEHNHMNTLERLLDAQERITELTAERDALKKRKIFAVERPIEPRGVVE